MRNQVKFQLLKNKAVLLLMIFLTLSGSLFGQEPEVYNGDYSPKGNLIVTGTIIVYGDLIMGFNEDLTINESGILIVFGTITIGKNVDVATSGYLIAENFYAPGKWGGKFQVGSESKVYIDNVTVKSGDFKHLDVLEPNNHRKIYELEDAPEAGTDHVLDIYIGALCGNGVDAGTLSLALSPDIPICEGGFTPKIIGTVVNNVSYEWLGSTDLVTWDELNVGAKDYSPVILNSTKYFVRQIQKANGCRKKTDPIEITVVPAPAPKGVFF